MTKVYAIGKVANGRVTVMVAQEGRVIGKVQPVTREELVVEEVVEEVRAMEVTSPFLSFVQKKRKKAQAEERRRLLFPSLY